MISRIRRYATSGLIAGVVALAAGGSCPGGLAVHDMARLNATSALASTGLASEPTVFRLRRLHLVRPDLIPYPIDYEIVC
jgi:hypothetical protein